MITTILLFIIIIGVLILSHEFGHFIVAKKSGMRVDEFGFGFPPKLYSIKKGETTYSFNLLPIGGFVKIYGEEPLKDENQENEGADKDSDRLFYKQPIWKRVGVIVAGVVMNVLVAYLLFSGGHMMGTPEIVNENANVQEFENISVQIIGFTPESPAEEAGIKVGDKIVELESSGDSAEIATVEEAQNFINDNLGEVLIFNVARGGETHNIEVRAREDVGPEEGATGIQLARVGTKKFAPHAALWEGVKTTANTTGAITVAFGGLLKQAVTDGSVPQSVAGPVGIASMTGTVKDMGMVFVLQFIALISLNLAILNIIPFPALDGGRLAFLVAEKVKGSPVSKKVEQYAHTVGFALLIILIILITYRDVIRIF